MQAIATTAGFHFAYIEQGGLSLYSIMALKGDQPRGAADHRRDWRGGDQSLLAVARQGRQRRGAAARGRDRPTYRREVPGPDRNGGELAQTNLILPEPCEFLHRGLPDCSIVRPTLDVNGGALATIKSFTADRVFEGQSPRFFTTLHQLAREADAAQRQVR
jgi:hypothetical protein